MRLGWIVLAAVVLIGCDKKPDPPKSTLLEVVSLKGTCKEDQVSDWTAYTASVVRSKDNTNGSVIIVGYATMAGDMVKATLDEVQKPTAYHPAQLINFFPLKGVDTTQAHWTMHGISSRGDEDHDQGLDSTCEMDVVERGHKLPDLVPTKP